eukprot:m51a1_g9223 hypothetical protein (115) ;mRNA; r:66330-66674
MLVKPAVIAALVACVVVSSLVLADNKLADDWEARGRRAPPQDNPQALDDWEARVRTAVPGHGAAQAQDDWEARVRGAGAEASDGAHTEDDWEARVKRTKAHEAQDDWEARVRKN